MKLEFGSPQSKLDAIAEHKRQVTFESEVREAMLILAAWPTLPPLENGLGKLRDYPPLVQRFSIYVLEEANRREMARRSKSGEALDR